MEDLEYSGQEIERLSKYCGLFRLHPHGSFRRGRDPRRDGVDVLRPSASDLTGAVTHAQAMIRRHGEHEQWSGHRG